MIRLFLENHEVELTESVSFAITKQFEDITSPADIKNDYSKTVEIPFSQSNNKLFGMLFSADRLTPVSSGQLTGIYFDPYKKVNFRLQWGDTVLMQGYAKNISVSKEANGKGSYSITLNGELGKVFQEMKKITFDTSTEEQQYLIDGSNYIEETINKELVYELWNNEPDFTDLSLTNKYILSINQATGETVKTPNMSYKRKNYLGFAPNNSFNTDFDYKTYQYLDSTTGRETSESFADELGSRIIDGRTFEQKTGITPETIIGNGLLPRAIGEFRSYLQLPYIYFNKLFQILIAKTKELTGYTTELDEDWFSVKNPYWARTVYMLKTLDYKEQIKNEQYINPEQRYAYFIVHLYDGKPQSQPNTYDPVSYEPVFKTLTLGGLDVMRQKLKNNETQKIHINQTIPVKISLTTPRNSKGDIFRGTPTDVLVMNDYTKITVEYRLKDQNGNVVKTTKTVAVGPDYMGNDLAGEQNVVVIENFRNVDYYEYETTIPVPLYLEIDKSEVGTNFSLEVAAYMGGPTTLNMNQSIVYYFGFNDVSSKNQVVCNTITIKQMRSEGNSISTNTLNRRTNYTFTLNDLWDKEFNLFTEVLNYCKMFRIGVFCDDIHKKLIFKPLSTYFKNYNILDWTDKLDLSKEYHIKPITFENKYLLFNYKGVDTQLNKDYKEKFGVRFGEYKLTTQYDFNSETKELYSGLYNAIPSTDTTLSWGDIYDNFNILYTIPAEILPNNKDKDNKAISIFGSFFLYYGLARWDTSNNLRSVKISDDTYLQTISNKFFYSQDSDKLSTVCYPLLDIKANGHNLMVFKTPMENYTYKEDNYKDTMSIFDNFWKNYLDERYNVQNKIVTCYLRLTPYDFANFKYNNFIKIENQLYMVNKIYDYQIDEVESTKVDLITIQDIDGYTQDNFIPERIFMAYNQNKVIWNRHDDYVSVGNNTPFYITSTSDFSVTFSSEFQTVDFELYADGVHVLDGSQIHAGENIKFTTWWDGGSWPSSRIAGTLTFENGRNETIIIDVVVPPA